MIAYCGLENNVAELLTDMKLNVLPSGKINMALQVHIAAIMVVSRPWGGVEMLLWRLVRHKCASETHDDIFLIM